MALGRVRTLLVRKDETIKALEIRRAAVKQECAALDAKLVDTRIEFFDTDKLLIQDRNDKLTGNQRLLDNAYFDAWDDFRREAGKRPYRFSPGLEGSRRNGFLWWWPIRWQWKVLR